MLFLFIASCCALVMSVQPAALRHDTSTLIGAEYTPSGATNQFWLWFYPRYAAQVDRELAAASSVLGVTTIRVFLHSLMYEANATQLLLHTGSLLAAAWSHNVRIGLVLHDDCWNAAGASLLHECMPTPGLHNGCWMRSPQDADRTSVLATSPMWRALWVPLEMTHV